MSTTTKQIAANQTNAQKSTGPQTEAGKQRSALNACRHGLTGHVTVLPHEDRQAYDAFAKQLLTELDVEGAHEESLATLYIGCLWKLQRAHSIEDNLYTLGLMEDVAGNLDIENPEAHNAISHAKTFRADSAAFGRIGLYAQRLANQSKTLLRQLQEVQTERRARERVEIAEATRAYKFKKMQDEPFDPQQHGFVCSIRQIELHLRRQQINQHAAIAERCHFDRPQFLKMAA